MAKSNLFVRCPKFKTECDIDTCPRFLSNIEVITGSDGDRTANGFCFERGTRYITNVPQKYFCDRQQTAAWELIEKDARDEVEQLTRIRHLLEQNFFFVVTESEEGESSDIDAILFDTISNVIMQEINDLHNGKITTPKVACTWQNVLPEMISFRDEETIYYIEENPNEHPEAFEQKLPDGEKVLMNLASGHHRLTPKVDRVRKLTGQYLELALQQARSRNSSSKGAWLQALGNYNRVKNAWTMPESRLILDEMSKAMIEGATLLSIDLTIPDPSNSIRNSETADAVAERLQPNFNEQKKSIESVAKTVKSINDSIKLFFGKILNCFIPRKDIKRENIESVINKAHRYDCLARVSEPHRSQLMAVIDYTYDHPIAHEKDRKFGKDTISLSEAALTVFNANKDKWSRIPGAWTDFNSFKVGCYQHRGKKDDPYKYAT